MAQDLTADEDGTAARARRRPVLRFFQISLVILLLVLGAAWLQRERIARDLITDTLDGYGIEATYDIESIAPGAQVLTNIVIGDPDAPDAIVERAEIHITPHLGLPSVGRLTLVRPRVWGRIVDGEPSFGALDPLIFTDSDAPFEFPDMRLELTDGRALIEGDYGPVAMRLDGKGHLRGGFAGEFAASAPDLRLPGCRAEGATIYGTLNIDAERPQFAGPLRFASLACAERGIAVAAGAIELDLRADRNLADLEGNASVRAGASSVGDNRLAALEGSGRFSWRSGDLTSNFALQGRDLRTGAARMALVDIDGSLRAQENFARMELETSLAGNSLMPGAQMDQAIASAADASQGTLLAPLLSRLRRQLAVETRGSTFEAALTARSEEGRLAVAIPEARVRGRSGASLLLVTRAQFAMGEDGVPRFTGNFATGGEGLPQISGRMEQEQGGTLEMRLRMAEYAAQDARLVLPDLRVTQGAGGAITLAGTVEASGPLPGGFARALALPLAGTISPAGAVSMWARCTDVTFDELQLANLRIGRQAVTLCPPRGSPILRYDAGGLKLAAGVPSLDLAGTLGESPIRLRTGPVGFAWPGAVSVREMDVVLGPAGGATRFTVQDLAARLGDEIAGTFAGTDVLLDAVPLDIRQAGGEWDYTDGVLRLGNARFMVEDRAQADRFEPLLAQGAVLTLADNRIATRFALEHPASGEKVARIVMRHDLSNGAGNADIAVDGITFRNGFQPRDLTELAYGVVSLVSGTVTGEGRIDWNADAITSSGSFSSDSLDLAAAFGPVRGARGTVVFTDLLGLTTAPAQRITIDSVNPGIEVTDGTVLFSLEDGALLRLESASWPFLGGRLTMQPLAMNIGVTEVRRYVFQIEGLEAARFIEHMELNNLAATGVFDGNIPIVFDELGNGRLEGGQLSARPPGGNLSYVGELTYQDLSYVGNMAFAALRDLGFREMDIQMDGPLTGELVTRVRFEGVSQGETAESNFITRRIAQLPIELRVNIRAPFYQLISTTRSLYDPTAVRDPRGLGLIRTDGTVLRNQTDQAEVDARDAAASDAAGSATDESDIQPPESEAMP